MSQPARQRPRPPVKGGGDPAVIFFAVIAGGFLVSCWPAIVWHGYGGPAGTGWRWDIHSTVAEAVWVGVVAFIAGLIIIGNKPAKRVPPPVKPVTPPGPDPAVTARLLRELDAAEGYAGLVEEAQSGEELDYLARNGKLPGGWPFRNPQKGHSS